MLIGQIIPSKEKKPNGLTEKVMIFSCKEQGPTIFKKNCIINNIIRELGFIDPWRDYTYIL